MIAFIPNKSFRLGIPLELGFETDGNISQVAHAGTAMADLDGRRRIGATLDAVQKVADVVVAGMVLLGARDIFRPDAFWRRKKVLPHVFDTNKPLGTFENTANRRLTSEAFHDRAVGILGTKERVRRSGKQAAFRQIVGKHVLHLRRSGTVHSESP